MNTLDALEQRLHDRTAVIGIIGLGYVGLPLLLRYVESGYRVLGFDIDPDKAATLNRGESYIRHIGDDAVAAARHGFEAISDFARAGEVDALILCLPTPLDRYRQPDLGYITRTLETLSPHLRAGQVIALESTTWPGTTEEIVLPALTGAGLVVGEDTALVYSPEREDPGNRDFTTATIPKVIAGHSARCLAIARALYGGVVDRLVPVRNTRTAEMVKLLENIHRAVNIGLVNEMKMVADAMDIDIHEVIEAAASKPFGFVPYQPGPGLGGHCIPIDPFYLTWKAREYGLDTRFIELAGEINHAMPAWVVGKITEALNNHGKPVKGSRILLLGLAYKKNVDDVRETPAAELIERLHRLGARVEYSDPHVDAFPPMRHYDFDLNSVEADADNLAAADCVVIVTDHDAFDYDAIRTHARLIVDSRGRYREPAEHIIKA